jgi:hypothetical protein
MLLCSPRRLNCRANEEMCQVCFGSYVHLTGTYVSVGRRIASIPFEGLAFEIYMNDL